MIVNVGIGECKLSQDPQVILTVSNLGSCLGIAAFDPIRKSGGIVHCLLPSSSIDSEEAHQGPATYVDTGFSLLLMGLVKAGASIPDLLISVAGGARINSTLRRFQMGQRNLIALNKELQEKNIALHSHNIGGDSPCSMYLSIESGQVRIKTTTSSGTLSDER